ncbi:hypothetical protein D3C71_1470930 [compost metagenome]
MPQARADVTKIGFGLEGVLAQERRPRPRVSFDVGFRKAGEIGLHRAALVFECHRYCPGNGSAVQLVVLLDAPQVEEVLVAGVVHAKLADRVELLRDDRLERIARDHGAGDQPRQQRRDFHRHRIGRDHVSEADIYAEWDTRGVNPCV